MIQGKKFCTGCGAMLTPDDRFCGSCGKQLAANSAPTPVTVTATPPAVQVAPAPTPAPVKQESAAANVETLIGVIPSVSRKKGLMGVESLNIIVTQRRMIFAVATNEMMKEEAKRVVKEGGFFAGMLNAATVGYTFYKRYLNMAPDAALAESPQNFAVDLSRIRKVKIEAGKEIKSYASMKANQSSILKHHQYENGKLEIETFGDKYNFDLPGSSMDMALETVKKAGLY
jgi:hypothetical protein